MSVTEETEVAIAAAGHLTAADAAAVAALRGLARRLDDLAESGGLVDGKLDVVAVPTFLRYCHDLGLTPAGREKLRLPATPAGGKLAELRALHRRAG